MYISLVFVRAAIACSLLSAPMLGCTADEPTSTLSTTTLVVAARVLEADGTPAAGVAVRAMGYGEGMTSCPPTAPAEADATSDARLTSPTGAVDLVVLSVHPPARHCLVVTARRGPGGDSAVTVIRNRMLNLTPDRNPIRDTAYVTVRFPAPPAP